MMTFIKYARFFVILEQKCLTYRMNEPAAEQKQCA